MITYLIIYMNYVACIFVDALFLSLSWKNALCMSQIRDVCFYGFLLYSKNFRTFVKMVLKSLFLLFVCLL